MDQDYATNEEINEVVGSLYNTTTEDDIAYLLK